MRSQTQERGVAMDMKWAKVAFLTLTLVLGATGCGEEERVGTPTASDFLKERQTLATNTAQPKAVPTAAATAAEAGESEKTGYAATERDYFYDSRNKRDPFRSFRFSDADEASEGEAFGPLGDFELGQLELSAVIWDANNPRALILDPGGRAYIVREGSQIGKNSGQVIHIGDNLVLVKETYENLAGEQTTKDVELRIRLSQGG
jgi:type IV pilus assembly protein PilP